MFNQRVRQASTMSPAMRRHSLTSAVWCAVVALWMCLLCATAAAEPYGAYDVRRLLIPASNGQGGRVDGRYLDAMMQDLERHAGNYPVRFDSPGDRQRAERDVGHLIKVLDLAFGQGAPEPILLRMGMLGAIGHNLDLPQAAGYAQRQFAELLAARPDDAVANYQYGRFLAASARPKEAIPYLEKARGRRMPAAANALGMVHLALGDKTSALTALAEYQKAEPGDERARQLIDAVRQGRIELSRANGP